MGEYIVPQNAGCLECGKKIQARSLCATHYSRLQRRGIKDHKYARGSLSERLAALSVKNEATGCIEWVSNKNKAGYGRLSVENKLWLAHRASYFNKHGDIPDSMLVCHKCDNPSCINTDHLFLGTDFDNMMDKVHKKRHSHGGKSPIAKLTEDQVIMIRGDGRLQTEIAKDYGISKGAVSAIKVRKNWAHIA